MKTKMLLYVLLTTTLLVLSSCSVPKTADVNSNRMIEVRVVDQTQTSIPGASFEDFQLITTYDYDETGKLVSTSQSTNYVSPNLNLCKTSFTYDELNKVIFVEYAYEQYDWTVCRTESFTYDDNGNCDTYAYEITSQGVGTYVFDYEYSDDNVLVRAEETEYFGNIERASHTLNWTYSKNGRINKVSSSSPGANGFGLSEELTDETNGVYSYIEVDGATRVLRFDQEGSLVSIEEVSPRERNIVTYSYKTIQVKASEYVPSIYSNPQGFETKWKPALDECDRACVVKRAGRG